MGSDPLGVGVLLDSCLHVGLGMVRVTRDDEGDGGQR